MGDTVRKKVVYTDFGASWCSCICTTNKYDSESRWQVEAVELGRALRILPTEDTASSGQTFHMHARLPSSHLIHRIQQRVIVQYSSERIVKAYCIITSWRLVRDRR
jgi:hypothetical protein